MRFAQEKFGGYPNKAIFVLRKNLYADGELTFTDIELRFYGDEYLFADGERMIFG